MTDPTEQKAATDEQHTQASTTATEAISADYNVLGYNRTGTGVTVGVVGKVDSPDGSGLYTPADAVDGADRSDDPTVALAVLTPAERNTVKTEPLRGFTLEEARDIEGATP